MCTEVDDTIKYDDVTTLRQKTSRSTPGGYTSLPKEQLEKQFMTETSSPLEERVTEIITELVTEISETTTFPLTSLERSTATSQGGGFTSHEMSPLTLSLQPDSTTSVDYSMTTRALPGIKTNEDVSSTHLVESSDNPLFIDVTTQKKYGVSSNGTQPDENVTALSVTSAGLIIGTSIVFLSLIIDLCIYLRLVQMQRYTL